MKNKTKLIVTLLFITYSLVAMGLSEKNDNTKKSAIEQENVSIIKTEIIESSITEESTPESVVDVEDFSVIATFEPLAENEVLIHTVVEGYRPPLKVYAQNSNNEQRVFFELTDKTVYYAYPSPSKKSMVITGGGYELVRELYIADGKTGTVTLLYVGDYDFWSYGTDKYVLYRPYVPEGYNVNPYLYNKYFLYSIEEKKVINIFEWNIKEVIPGDPYVKGGFENNIFNVYLHTDSTSYFAHAIMDLETLSITEVWDITDKKPFSYTNARERGEARTTFD